MRIDCRSPFPMAFHFLLLIVGEGGNSRGGTMSAGLPFPGPFRQGIRWDPHLSVPLARQPAATWNKSGGACFFWAYRSWMLDNQTEPRTIAPLFSVIIPLE